ncbi:sterol carrier family protein [Kitasatospora sp. NPDC006697]|uniref:sterol carrier family protein n=1 Tax=Kitasatospora sp. NPDC006697 TaxID=3364020 RepID=UPI00367BBD5B
MARTAARKARSYDPVKVRAALAGELGAVRATAAGADPAPEVLDRLLVLLGGGPGEALEPAVEALLGRLAELPDEQAVALLVETVLLADDLAAALGIADFPHERFALATASRVLADAFAARVPGGAVELRVPPFAVVQAVPGPKHTRGTPPNVVEAAPLDWIRLATGRLSWAEAVEGARLTASGERSDLSAYLPVAH